VLGGNVKKQAEYVMADVNLSDEEKTRQVQALYDEWQSLHDQVIAAGGLHIIGTERHESRRIDNQLRGRGGRQGDPGSSRFYLSMDDSLLRIFAGERLKAMMNRLKIPRGEAIESGMVSRSIESAQRKVEGHNFDMRKQLLEYDDVANDQRRVIYAQRNDLLDEGADESVRESVHAMRDDVLEQTVRDYVPHGSIEEQWHLPQLQTHLREMFSLDIPVVQWMAEHKSATDEDLIAHIQAVAREVYHAKIERVGEEGFQNFERVLMLQTIDHQWREHLSALDHLRQGIHLRGYAQKNPKQEYKREAFELFSMMLDRVKANVSGVLMNVQIQEEEQVAQAEQNILAHEQAAQAQMHLQHEGDEDLANEISVTAAGANYVDEQGNAYQVGRNEPCPCGSGKKFKQCHGKLK